MGGASAVPVPRLGRWVLGVAFVAYAVWAALYIHRTSFVVDGERVFCLWDDGMISMQYARNLARGDGLVWNAGQTPVQGYSNLGVTVVMAMVHALPLPPRTVPLAFQLLNLGLLLAAAGLVFALCRCVCPSRPQVAVAATLASLGGASLSVWSLQGSDAGFMTVWMLATLLAMARARGPAGRWPWWVFVLLASGLLLRVDAIAAYVPLGLVAVLDGRPRGRRLWGCALLGAAVLGALLLWGRLRYGDWLPNTVHLKATGSPRALVLSSGFGQLLEWGPWLTPAVVLAGAGVAKSGRHPIVVAAAAVVTTAVAASVWVGGDWAPEFGNRFVAPCLPLLMIVAAVGAAPLCERALVDFSVRVQRWSVVPVLITVAWVANPPEASADFFSMRTKTMFRRYNARNHRVARYIAEHTSADTVVAVHWAGVPIYFSDRIGLDVLGKSDRHIARLRVERFFPGHSKWDWDYVLGEARPVIIVGATRGLADHPQYQADYLTVRRDGERAFAIRRDGLAHFSDPAAVLEGMNGEPYESARGPEPSASVRP